VFRAQSLFAQVQLDRHAIRAGGRKEAAPMVVSNSLCFCFKKLRIIDLKTIGQRRARKMTIKEEPKSSGHVATRKCKVYSTKNANLIGILEPVEDADANADADTAQPAGKRAKTAAASSSHVQFDGVAILKPTRKSTHTAKTNSKKELFVRLSQEYATIAKTYEELSEMWD
jgi:hypothetical protein